MSVSKIILKRNFLVLSVLITVLYVGLELYYHFFISDQFFYMGFVANFNLNKYLITKFVFILFLIASHDLYGKSKFLYSVYLILLLFFYIPNAILFSFSDLDGGPFISNSFFVAVFLITPYIKFSIPTIAISPSLKGPALIAISILLLIPILATYKLNFNLRTLFLSDVYETRDSFSDSIGGYLTYFYNFLAKTIIPVSLVFFMIKKKPALIGLSFLVLIYLYVISGNKLVYFSSILVIYFFYMGKDYISKIGYFFLIMTALFILFPMIDNYLDTGSPVLSGTFVNRLFFIPALLNHFYFDFFNGHPFYFAESHFFSNYVESPYNLPVGFMITKVYWNAPTAFANNGIISDGFMNLGYWGVALFSIIFSLLFSLFNSFKLHVGFFGLFFCYIYLFLSVPLLNCFITGGILIFVILAGLLLRPNSALEKVGS